MKAKKIKRLCKKAWPHDDYDTVTYVNKGKTRMMGNCFRKYYQEVKRSQK